MKKIAVQEQHHDRKKIPVIILCGGKGSRLREETEYKPKPLVDVGGKPILWHIMKGYAHHGFNKFILCLGYKGHMIKEFFLNYEYMSYDFMMNTKTKERKIFDSRNSREEWDIIFADTGKDTNTGGRIKKVKKYVPNEIFMATYGDGLSDVNIESLLDFHIRQKKMATITGFHPRTKYGQVNIGERGEITSFQEKPSLADYINGGFFVFDRRFFGYLKEDSVLEREPFERLVEEQQLGLYKHEGFWFAVDTYKDYLEINGMYESGTTPWMIWRK
jgi:glucose-1-phosphate cytidylyltransferase